jgi:hypothetical protein
MRFEIVAKVLRAGLQKNGVTDIVTQQPHDLLKALDWS